MKYIKYYTTLILVLMMMVLNQNSFFREDRFLIFPILTVIYLMFSFPIFRIKHTVIKLTLLINSIILILISLNISLVENNKLVILVATCIMSIMQIILFMLLKGVDISIKEYHQVENFYSRLDTINYFKLINCLNYVTILFPLLFYNLTSVYTIIVVYFLNIFLRAMRANLLIKAYFSEILLVNHLIKLLIGELLIVLVLSVLLLIYRDIWLFINLSLFSNFVVPFLRQKEYELLSIKA